jgi:hypothetical protein
MLRFNISLVSMMCFVCPLLGSAESIVLGEVMAEEKIAPIDLNFRLAGFLDFVKNLQQKGLLDGSNSRWGISY